MSTLFNFSSAIANTSLFLSIPKNCDSVFNIELISKRKIPLPQAGSNILRGFQKGTIFEIKETIFLGM